MDSLTQCFEFVAYVNSCLGLVFFDKILCFVYTIHLKKMLECLFSTIAN
jgi:hypothetical protein